MEKINKKVTSIAIQKAVNYREKYLNLITKLIDEGTPVTIERAKKLGLDVNELDKLISREMILRGDANEKIEMDFVDKFKKFIENKGEKPE